MPPLLTAAQRNQLLQFISESIQQNRPPFNQFDTVDAINQMSLIDRQNVRDALRSEFPFPIRLNMIQHLLRDALIWNQPFVHPDLLHEIALAAANPQPHLLIPPPPDYPPPHPPPQPLADELPPPDPAELFQLLHGEEQAPDEEGPDDEAAQVDLPHNDICIVCTDPIPTKPYVVLPCRHACHERCLDSWRLSEHGAGSHCPICLSAYQNGSDYKQIVQERNDATALLQALIDDLVAYQRVNGNQALRLILQRHFIGDF